MFNDIMVSAIICFANPVWCLGPGRYQGTAQLLSNAYFSPVSVRALVGLPGWDGEHVVVVSAICLIAIVIGVSVVVAIPVRLRGVFSFHIVSVTRIFIECGWAVWRDCCQQCCLVCYHLVRQDSLLVQELLHLVCLA